VRVRERERKDRADGMRLVLNRSSSFLCSLLLLVRTLSIIRLEDDHADNPSFESSFLQPNVDDGVTVPVERGRHINTPSPSRVTHAGSFFLLSLFHCRVFHSCPQKHRWLTFSPFSSLSYRPVRPMSTRSLSALLNELSSPLSELTLSLLLLPFPSSLITEEEPVTLGKSSVLPRKNHLEQADLSSLHENRSPSRDPADHQRTLEEDILEAQLIRERRAREAGAPHSTGL